MPKTPAPLSLVSNMFQPHILEDLRDVLEFIELL